jgi:hypothetical protein
MASWIPTATKTENFLLWEERKMFIGKNLFVNDKCIMYENCCSNAGWIFIPTDDETEILVCDGEGTHMRIPFDKFKKEFNNINELYRRILFLRFGVRV